MSDVVVKQAPKTMQERMLGMMGIDFAAVQAQMEEAKQIIDDYFVDVNDKLEEINEKLDAIVTATAAAPAPDDSGSVDPSSDSGSDTATDTLKVVKPKAK